MSNLKGTTAALFLLLGLFFAHHTYNKFSSRYAIDFYQFWMIGNQVKESKGFTIYSSQQQSKVALQYYGEAKRKKMSRHHEKVANYATKWLYPTSTPFFYSVAAFFNTGDFDFDYQVYRWISLIFYFSGILLLCRLLKFNMSQAFLSCLIFSIWFWPFLRDIRNGNVNQIQVGIIGLYFWLANSVKIKYKNILLGTLLGLLFVFKPNIIFGVFLLFLSWLLFKKNKQFLQTALGFSSGILISFLFTHLYFQNILIWKHWFDYFPKFSLSKTFYHRFSMYVSRDSVTLAIVLSVLLLLTLILAVYFYKKKQQSKEPLTFGDHYLTDYFFFNLGIGFTFLVGSIIHSHYFLLMVPSALYLLRPREDKEPVLLFDVVGRQLWGVMGTFLLACYPLAISFGFQSDGNITKLTYIGVLCFMYALFSEFVFRPPSKKNENFLYEAKRVSFFIFLVLFIVLYGSYKGRDYGLKADYYIGTNFEKLYKSRRDPRIKFHWGHRSPLWFMPKDHFSVRWTGRVYVQRPGVYGFQINSNDGARLWIKNQPIIDSWNDGPSKKAGEIYLESGFHDLKVDYFDSVGEAKINLSWKFPKQKTFYTLNQHFLKPH